ncbi:uncharacterized protein PGTG_05847 [Puccinia graminis f. sp. tritici CRL 75-36-700-3]|uniref:Uncharacterized protein n=1 Tax=Puccinia graminis f. sp. tritici (strain CRL 75-36-700-3 / race SCCL) TaxID=418459 RepID=E3K5V5_PUCGT|nr:uncharacterized protein PGTG_05847 [Puccinia graminis f. sp. tritici CRL 75-36-700-3]EFP79526.2 hypothetical protein PGTG_05847 [Puccinia graminis f. sp. tritici CRL 75-36-700-3]
MIDPCLRIKVHNQVDPERQPKDLNEAFTSNTPAEVTNSNPDENTKEKVGQPETARLREADAPESSRSRGTARPGTARPREAIRIPRREVFLVEEERDFRFSTLIHGLYLLYWYSN